MKYSLWSLPLSILALAACSHETTQTAQTQPLADRAIASTHTFTCTGTVSDGGDNTAHPAPIRLTFDAKSKTLTVNDHVTVPLTYSTYKDAGLSSKQELIMISKGDGKNADRRPASWEQRIQAWGLTISVRDQNQGPYPTGFYVGQGDLKWSGQVSCPNWRAGIPSDAN